MFINESVFYQIYPLGFCNAPKENDGLTVSRINKVTDWIPHLKKLGINALYFSPIFESDTHGYDTRDYYKIDCRLGTNDDFVQVVAALHENGINTVLDGVFNHVGRGFWAFQDVIRNRQDSLYKNWFQIDFNGNSNYNDGFWYEGWEGHFELVKLNLNNEEVINHIFSAVKSWMDIFDIDGLRLDVAYCLDKNFLRKLRNFCNSLKPDFPLIGEILFGDYNSIVNDEMLHSCTNYECYKGLYSSFNEMNMFEISYSLNRQFGSENWTLYKNKHLLSFVDNHDVTRVASILKEIWHLPLVYGMLFAIPGIPCIYYGSEWGVEGKKENGDYDLRPSFDQPEHNELTDLIETLSKIHKTSKAICYGSYKNLIVTNRQLVFERVFENERIIIAINADSVEYYANINSIGMFSELITGSHIELTGQYLLPGFSISYLKQL